MVAKEFFFNPFESEIEADKFEKVMSGECELFLLAYVDYIDVFKVHYRGGYARRFIPNSHSRNNLIFVNFKGYNYDRERDKNNPDENHDWT